MTAAMVEAEQAAQPQVLGAQGGQLGLQLVNGRGLADLQMMLAFVQRAELSGAEAIVRALPPGIRKDCREVYVPSTRPGYTPTWCP